MQELESTQGYQRNVMNDTDTTAPLLNNRELSVWTTDYDVLTPNYH